jgi:hypothetical protein
VWCCKALVQAVYIATNLGNRMDLLRWAWEMGSLTIIPWGPGSNQVDKGGWFCVLIVNIALDINRIKISLIMSRRPVAPR